ncbi:hypothetical protein Q4Q39_10060 [Flavivirga amylovorans]|uniref:Uncharacterized protein n=1 Tax=Flavivirga amylovorans TaxID=870486 RepID=A0ABT8X210_9FLAO|nr:hypothetical protein [Flavivirga amylovorans]MDO5987742.1 hypothetical protein [Flavivirga amylovorans]
MKSTTRISRCLNSITQESLFTNRIIPSHINSHEDTWKRLKRYAY